jgi:hypothetical protein
MEQPKFDGLVNVFQSLWIAPPVSDLLLRLDLFELTSWQHARDFMLLELGEFQRLRVRRLTDPAIGDVSFADENHASVLFARDHFVLLIRSAGRRQTSVLETAIELENLLLSPANP